MQFLYPIFLWGALGALIPLIIHFFNFQRPKKVYFTNTELLREVQQTAVSRNRFKNLLTLLLRMLAVIFLAVAFAQPVILRENATKASKGSHVSIYFDNSFSTQNLIDNKRIFDIGAQAVEKITEAYPNTTAFQLIDNLFEGNAHNFYDKSKVLDKISALPMSNLGRDLKTVQAKQVLALDKVGASETGHIFWISDFQKSTIGKLSDIPADSNQLYYLLPTLPTKNANVYIDSIWLENPFVRVGETNELNVKLKNTGDEAIDEKNIKFILDGKQVATSVFSIPAKSDVKIVLNFSVAESGDKACSLQIEDFPLLFDNEHFFVLPVAPKIKVCVIYQGNESFAEKAYKDVNLFDLKTFSVTNIDFNSLNNIDLIVFENITSIDNALSSTIIQLSQTGVNFAIFPNATANLTEIFKVFPLSNITSATNSELQPLLVPNANQPFFEGVFENISSTMNMPSVKPIMNLNGGNKILKMRNENTFLAEYNFNQSSVYVFASPTSATHGNFPFHAIFVPVMYKIALNSAMRAEKLYWSFAENNAVFTVDSLGKNDIFKLRSADGYEMIPAQRSSNTKVYFELPKNSFSAGVYEILRKNDNSKVGLIAFNFDKKESNTECYSIEEIEAFAKTRKNFMVFKDIDPSKLAAEFKDKNFATALWKYFVVLTLFVLLAETLVIRYWKS